MNWLFCWLWTSHKLNSYFANFEQVYLWLNQKLSSYFTALWTSQKLNSYFANFEQVGYFSDIEQIKKGGCFFQTTQLVRLPLVTYPSLCSTCVTYQTLCHAIGHQLLPTHPFTASATDLRERFLLSGIFYLTLLPAGFKASLGPAVQLQS